jgi:hypothetical protein
MTRKVIGCREIALVFRATDFLPCAPPFILDSALSSAVSAALVLASLVGIFQLFLFTFGASAILNVSGLSSSNGMHSAALAYTRTRALGTPFFTVWLVTNNVFRGKVIHSCEACFKLKVPLTHSIAGLGDAKSPLIGAIIYNVINVVTDYVFLQRLDLGIVGCALASTVAQATALLPLLWILNKRVPIQIQKLKPSSFAKYLSTYGSAGVYLLGRSIARTASYSYSSRRAVSPSANFAIFLLFLTQSDAGSSWSSRRQQLQYYVSNRPLDHDGMRRNRDRKSVAFLTDRLR